MSTDLPLHDYRPQPALVLPRTRILRPRFPVIDCHSHLGQLIPGMDTSGGWASRPVQDLLAVMDQAGVRTIVDLDGQWGDALEHELDRYQRPYPDRFLVFCGIDYDLIPRQRDFGPLLARALRQNVAAGARGIKLWKLLSLRTRDADGKLVNINDPRLDELYATAAELKIPVSIHVADPVAFFQPLDCRNERWEELHAHPDWHFFGPGFPSFEAIMEQLADVLERHRKTTFIACHVGCYAENLGWVSYLLDRCPNVYTDIGARLGELGRIPYTARDFFLRHADRILFGLDMTVDVETYRVHYRFLETRDEYFPYGRGEVPSQCRWMIYGLHLPDEVLQKVYFQNAEKLFSITSTGFQPQDRSRKPAL